MRLQKGTVFSEPRLTFRQKLSSREKPISEVEPGAQPAYFGSASTSTSRRLSAMGRMESERYFSANSRGQRHTARMKYT